MFGPYGSFPRQLGGGKPVVETLHEDLLAGYGDAFSKERGGYLWSLTYADACALWASWCTCYRVLSESNPATAHFLLDWWERFYRLSIYGLNLTGRRRQLAEHEALQGAQQTFQDLEATLRRRLGDTFVEMHFVPYGLDNAHVPDGSYPWGTVSSATPWGSNCSHLVVKLDDAAPNVPAGEFLERVGLMEGLLNARLNAWVTYGWHTIEGFTLDQQNLNYAAFDS